MIDGMDFPYGDFTVAAKPVVGQMDIRCRGGAYWRDISLSITGRCLPLKRVPSLAR
jgi:hypothetical protein